VTDDILTIGRFAKATGLTIDTLRHWDAEGLLLPADVDPATGYRRYRPDQVAQARAIAALRDLELSVPAIRALLEADDAGDRAAILKQEQTRLEARTARLQRALHRLSMVALSASTNASTPGSPSTPPSTGEASASKVAAPEKEIHVPTPPQPPTLDAATHRALGVGLYNHTWDFFEMEHRTPDQDDEMLETAYASAYHWRFVGHAANRARSHWILSRAHAVLGRPEPALHHARRCIEILEAGGEGIEDWDRAGAAEAMARALAVDGQMEAAAVWKAKAVQATNAIANEHDRKPIEGDLATLPI
jgi:DNA-binding transcriptional MerR regulator